ncbi:MAG: DNA adenine methylase [Actinomycetes bacterium]|jgi:adenine-specific DNA-methyltransferase|nr:DNA adenine methylase [Actinomycetes bacterium]
MIKYLGSKRTLVPIIGALATAIGARTALDLFTGTTRVAQELKRRGLAVTAVDLASYSHVLAQTFIATDATRVDRDRLADIVVALMALPGTHGYFTETFCVQSRFFQPKNGMRIDAIRDRIERDYREHPVYPILLTMLMLAADRVDSTTGVQMAYLKDWAPRAYHDLELRIPALLSGGGRAICGDATTVAADLGHFDLAYVDPPYNQHRYFNNYHIWETLIRWDAPEHYGKACKRIDARDEATKSPFNSRREMPRVFRETLAHIDAEVIAVSYNNEAWVSAQDISEWLIRDGHEQVAVFDFDFKRYVGAQIGIFNPAGEKVGTVSHTRNVEHIIVAGPRAQLAKISDALQQPCSR